MSSWCSSLITKPYIHVFTQFASIPLCLRAEAFLIGMITSFFNTEVVLLAFVTTAAAVVGIILFSIQTKYDITGMVRGRILVQACFWCHTTPWKLWFFVGCLDSPPPWVTGALCRDRSNGFTDFLKGLGPPFWKDPGQHLKYKHGHIKMWSSYIYAHFLVWIYISVLRVLIMVHFRQYNCQNWLNFDIFWRWNSKIGKSLWYSGQKLTKTTPKGPILLEFAVICEFDVFRRNSHLIKVDPGADGHGLRLIAAWAILQPVLRFSSSDVDIDFRHIWRLGYFQRSIRNQNNKTEWSVSLVKITLNSHDNFRCGCSVKRSHLVFLKRKENWWF